MKISSQLIREYKCELNSEEIKLFKDCLTYVRHRQLKHPECGAKAIGLEKVEQALLEMKIVGVNFEFWQEKLLSDKE